MRLTDRPRTLAEMRPDRQWPDAVQAVLDKGLARDVSARYQSAAQFGRDFAAAIAEMPATQATEGATMVIGAQSAAASAGVTKPIPATRVADSDEVRAQARASARMPAPVAAAPKSKLVPIVAGVAVVAVAGFFGVKQFANSATATTGDTSRVEQAPPTTPAASDSNAGSDPDPGPVNPGRPQNRTGNGAATPPVTPPTNPPNTQPAPNVTELLATWRTRLEALEVAETDAEIEAAGRVAREALRALDPVAVGLTGIQLDDTRYLQLLAHKVLDNTGEICRLGALVSGSSLLPRDQRDLAALIRGSVECR